MDEFRFVIKCFIFAAALLVLTQIKTRDLTIENHIQGALVNSKVSYHVNKVAEGGAKLIKDGYQYAVEYYKNHKKAEKPESTEVIAQTPDPEVVSGELSELIGKE